MVLPIFARSLKLSFESVTSIRKQVRDSRKFPFLYSSTTLRRNIRLQRKLLNKVLHKRYVFCHDRENNNNHKSSESTGGYSVVCPQVADTARHDAPQPHLASRLYNILWESISLREKKTLLS